MSLSSELPLIASQFITIMAFGHYGLIILVYSIPHTDDSTEEVIQRMIEEIERMVRVNNNNNDSQQDEIKLIQL